MKTDGINILERTLRENQGASVLVYTSHCFYGDQKIKCNLDYIFDANRVGFRVGEQEIYIYRNEIKDFGIKDGIYFTDSIMKIRIKLNDVI